MKKIILLPFVSLLLSGGGTILTIDDYDYSLHEFVSRHPKKQWERADSTQKDKMFTDFIKRELCVLEAKKLGLESDPNIAVKMRNRLQQILVNESYEQLVAVPLISPDDIKSARTFARLELFLSHILIGHSSAYLPKPPKRTIDEALLLAQDIKTLFLGGESFVVLADKHSDDPGVSQNYGSLGWVQWGATVTEFQAAAFSLEIGVYLPIVILV